MAGVVAKEPTGRGDGINVVVWPADPEARSLLERHVAAVAAGDQEAFAAPQCDFRGGDLSGLDLSAAYLLAANLAGVRLIGCDLYDATLSGADLRAADLSESDLGKVEAAEIQADAVVLRNARLFAANLSGAELRRAEFHGASLNSSQLWGADLSGAELRDCTLRFCHFGTAEKPTRLTDALFAGCAVDEASGWIIGPLRIGAAADARALDGDELASWFRDHGAPGVHVATG